MKQPNPGRLTIYLWTARCAAVFMCEKNLIDDVAKAAVSQTAMRAAALAKS